MKRLFLSFAVMLLSACAYPLSSIEQGQDPSAIYFVGAPPGVQVYVDGVLRGDAEDFNGRGAVLQVTQGRHLIELRRGSETILRKEVFVGEGLLPIEAR